jgi:hypothetical protein
MAGELVKDLRLAPLGSFGITPSAVPEMVALGKRSSSMKYNPVALPESVLQDILARAI